MWKTPTGYETTSWINSTKANDGDETTYAGPVDTPGDYGISYTWIFSSCSCERIRIRARRTGTGNHVFLRVLYYDGLWHLSQSNVDVSDVATWYEIDLSGGDEVDNVSKFKVEFRRTGYYARDCYLYEGQYLLEEVFPMAERNFKINESVPILYQAPNRESGLSGVVAEIRLPSGEPDSNFPDVTLTERGSTGTYYGTFEPDELGEWQAICHKADGDGQVTKRYSVGAHNVHSVGEAVGSVDTKVGGVDSKLDTVEDSIRGTDDDSLKTLSDQIDGVDTKVSTLDTPPMVS